MKTQYTAPNFPTDYIYRSTRD